MRAAYYLLLTLCLLPLVPGAAGMLLSAFSYIPVLGTDHFSLAAFSAVWQWHGIGYSLLLSVSSALLSSYLALLLCFAIVQTSWHSRFWRRVENLLAGLLAFPHVAFAIGFAFLFAPSGMLARMITPLLAEDGAHPIGVWLVQDSYALGLSVALALKETPFLLMMSIPVLQQLNVRNQLKVGAALGYAPHQTWSKVLFPQWLRAMRFALFAVIAYSVSVVDVSLILGPNTPPTFAVLVWQWFNDPDLKQLPRAAAGAVVLLMTAGMMLLAVVMIEKIVLQGYRRWQWSGRSGFALPGRLCLWLVAGIAIALVPVMLVWSVAQRWRFPDLWPSQFSLRFWLSEWPTMLPTLWQSIWIALLSGSLALLAAIVAHEYRIGHKRTLPLWLMVLPMLVPQISLLLGIQVTTLWVAAERYYLWVVWSHWLFAMPLVYLALDGPWRSYNAGYTRVGLSLGKSPWQLFWRIKAPLLLPAILYAWAVGISVSLAQYLPTLMLGGGRIATITTEAVALSSGFDRRVMAIYALWQALLPFIFFTLAVLLSRIQTRRRRTFSAPQIATTSEKP